MSLALRSGLRYFEGAKRYGAGVILGPDGGEPYLHRMDAGAEAEAARILAMPGEKECNLAINVAFDQRFMSKLALGLGCNIFGTSYATSIYAANLRGLMWGKTHEERASFNIRSLNYLDGAKDPTARLVTFRGGYTIRIMAAGDELVLSLNLPSGRPIHIVMANDPSLWADASFNLYRMGAAFVVVPQVERFAGPFPLGNTAATCRATSDFPSLPPLKLLK